MACDQQQPPGRNDVLCGHTFLRSQPREQSGARFGAIPLYQLGHVLVHLRRGLGGGRLLSGSRIELGDDCLGPRMEARFVLVRHPELLTDHRDRQRICEVVHEVDLVLGLHVVDESTGGAHHVGSHSAWMPWTGTQQGPLVDLPATGRRVEVDEMIMFRLVDGLVVEAREVWDEATMRRQLLDASMTAASNT